MQALYYLAVIKSFADRPTEDLFHGNATKRIRRFPHGVQKTALRRFDVLSAARKLDDLRSPGNRLEALKGALRGWYSIRVNDQWRVVFRWRDGHVYDVRLCDYH